MSVRAPHRRADLVVGALLGATVVVWGAWELARGFGVSDERLRSLVPSFGARQVLVDDPLALPLWVHLVLGTGLVACGVVVVAGVAQEARWRATGIQASVSGRTRSIAALLLSVGTGAVFTMVGAVMALAGVGAIAFESGDHVESSWFLGGIGLSVTLMSLLLTYSSVYRWMSGRGADDTAH